MEPIPAHEREPRCWQCGYSLRGLAESRCPECGTEEALDTSEVPRWTWTIILPLVGVGLAATSFHDFVTGFRYPVEVMFIALLQGAAVAACLPAWRHARGSERLVPLVALGFVLAILLLLIMFAISLLVR